MIYITDGFYASKNKKEREKKVLIQFSALQVLKIKY